MPTLINIIEISFPVERYSEFTYTVTRLSKSYLPQSTP